MLKAAYEAGAKAALEKLAVDPSMLHRLIGGALRRPELAMAGAGALAGGLLNRGTDPQTGQEQSPMMGALMGGLAGYGLGRFTPLGGMAQRAMPRLVPQSMQQPVWQSMQQPR